MDHNVFDYTILQMRAGLGIQRDPVYMKTNDARSLNL